MHAKNWFAIVCMAMMAAVVTPQTQEPAEKITESEHRSGPHGLEGWKLSRPFPVPSNRDPLPFRLLIAQNGKIVRKIEGDPFVWRWIFWEDGHSVAYETGPLHFGMVCHLADVRTGRVIQSIDCFHELPENAPAWAKKLESAK
jgi:hypothetical protein